MMRLRSVFGAWLLVASLSPLWAASSQAEDVAPPAPGPAFAAHTVPDAVFPELRFAWQEDSIFVHPSTLRLIGPGMSKDQIYAPLDVLHFGEALYVPTRNYIFDHRPADGSAPVQCQYQIRYVHRLVADSYWKDDTCARLLKGSHG